MQDTDEFWTEVLKRRQAEAVSILRTTQHHHGAGRARITCPSTGNQLYCAMGVLAEAAGIDARTLSWNSRIDDYLKVAQRWGLFGLDQVIMNLNDRTMMSFSQIADEIEKRLDKAWKRPGAFVGTLQTNQWIKTWLIQTVEEVETEWLEKHPAYKATIEHEREVLMV